MKEGWRENKNKVIKIRDRKRSEEGKVGKEIYSKIRKEKDKIEK